MAAAGAGLANEGYAGVAVLNELAGKEEGGFEVAPEEPNEKEGAAMPNELALEEGEFEVAAEEPNEKAGVAVLAGAANEKAGAVLAGEPNNPVALDEPNAAQGGPNPALGVPGQPNPALEEPNPVLLEEPNPALKEPKPPEVTDVAPNAAKSPKLLLDPWQDVALEKPALLPNKFAELGAPAPPRGPELTKLKGLALGVGIKGFGACD